MTGPERNWLQGQTAIVTGSVGSGIGRSTALKLAKAGANVVLNHGTGGHDRSDETRQVLDAIAKMQGNAIHVKADTRTSEGVATILADTRKAYGDPDILVNNAGAPWLDQDFTEVDAERWHQTLAAEVIGPSLLMKGVLPGMRRKRWGRIVNIAIDRATLGSLLDHTYADRLDRLPFPFTLGKLARSEMTRLLAPIEWRYGITINNICPGIIEDMSLDEAVKALDTKFPAPLSTPADIAELVLLLCSERMRGVTGSDIVMPGNVFSRLR